MVKTEFYDRILHGLETDEDVKQFYAIDNGFALKESEMTLEEKAEQYAQNLEKELMKEYEEHPEYGQTPYLATIPTPHAKQAYIAGAKENEKQLERAMEIIRDFLLIAEVEHLKDRYETVDEAEQFLKE